jgi:hypothetical protein
MPGGRIDGFNTIADYFTHYREVGWSITNDYTSRVDGGRTVTFWDGKSRTEDVVTDWGGGWVFLRTCFRPGQ